MNSLTEQQKKEKFERFFLCTFPKVKAFAWKLLGSEEDAEDVAQDIFVKLWQNPSLWEDLDTWDAYIYTMTRNGVFDFLKHQAIERDYQTVEAQKEIPLEPDITDKLYAEEMQVLIELALDNMPEQRRRIFIMSRRDGLSNAEIAERLGLSVRTVEHHIYLALQTLKKILLFAIFFVLA